MGVAVTGPWLPLPAPERAPAWPSVVTGTVSAGGLTGLLAAGAIALSWSVPIRGDVAVVGLGCVLVAASLGAALGVGVRRLGRPMAHLVGMLGAWLALPLTLGLLWADGLPTESLGLLLAATVIVAPILALLGLFVGEAVWRSAHPDPARMGIRDGLRAAEGVSVRAAIGAAAVVSVGLSELVLIATTTVYRAEWSATIAACLGVASASLGAGLGWVATRRGLDGPRTLAGRRAIGIPLWVAGLTVAFAIGPLAGLLSQIVLRPPIDQDLGPYPYVMIGLIANLVLSLVLALGGAGVAELAWWVARRER